jgi:hypothetical protein
MTVFNVGAVSQTGALNYTNLGLAVSGPVTLAGDNDVTNLAALLSGAGADFTYHDVDDVALAPAGGVSGITTNNGDINITTANGSIVVVNTIAAADVNAGTAGVVLEAGSLGAADFAVQLDASANLTGGAMIIRADHLDLATGATLNAGAGDVFLQPYNPGTLINLGGADAANTLGLTDVELDGVTAGSLIIGDVDAGAISFTSAITPAGTGRLRLVTAADIQDNNAGNDVTVTGLVMVAGTGIGVSGGNPLETTVGFVEARTSTGGIGIVEADELVVGAISAEPGLLVQTSGDIAVSANGSIILADIDGAAVVRGGSSSGDVFLTASGGTSSVSSNVDLPAITTPRGSITVQAGGNISLGVAIAANSDVRADGNVVLTAGNDIAINNGTDILSDNFGQNTGGDVTITAGGGIRVGDIIGGAATVGAGGNAGGSVTLNAGVGDSVSLDAPGPTIATVSSQSGDVTINTDRMFIDAFAGVRTFAPGHAVTIQPASSAGVAINVGGADGMFTLGLTDAELDRITTSLLRIGNPTGTGNITLSSQITGGTYSTLSLRTGGSILDGTGTEQADIAVINLALRAGLGIGLAANEIDTAVATLAFNTHSGAAAIANTGALTIGAIDDLASSSNLNGGIGVIALSPVTVASNVTAAGSIVLQAIDSAAAGDDLTVLGGVTVQSTNSNVQLVAGDNLTLQAGSVVQAFSSIQALVDFIAGDAGVGATATLGGTVIAGTSVALFGQTDVDTLIGSAANESLDGGGGADTMRGGAGNDTYLVDNAGDAVIENAGEGADTVRSPVHFTLPANVENLILTGVADLQGYGNGLVNALSGNSGSNILNGNGGADVMTGGVGNDAYFVDDDFDQVIENAGEGNDTVYASVHFGLSANVENLILQGGADLQG